jgi:hypothetical protein
MTVPIPAAEIIAERRYGGLRTARVFCPYCQSTHLHPWPCGDTTSLPYTAHCGQGAYTIGTLTTTERTTAQ